MSTENLKPITREELAAIAARPYTFPEGLSGTGAMVLISLHEREQLLAAAEEMILLKADERIAQQNEAVLGDELRSLRAENERLRLNSAAVDDALTKFHDALAKAILPLDTAGTLHPDDPMERAPNFNAELRAWLDQQTITSENIGDVRRRLFVPWSSQWNSIVRDETAARENKPAAAERDMSGPPDTGDDSLINVRRLRAENERLRKAIADEPELPGAMPEAMWAALVETITANDKEAAEEWMRIIVRTTKQGILNRAAAGPVDTAALPARPDAPTQTRCGSVSDCLETCLLPKGHTGPHRGRAAMPFPNHQPQP